MTDVPAGSLSSRSTSAPRRCVASLTLTSGSCAPGAALALTGWPGRPGRALPAPSGQPPLAALPFEDRNSLWLMFTRADRRSAMLDWEDSTRRLVAEYRSAMAEHLAEPAWKCLVSRLAATSPEFAELWQRHEIGAPENLTKRYLHPEAGLLRLNYTHLCSASGLGTRMTTYTPADSDTEARLQELRRRPAAAS